MPNIDYVLFEMGIVPLQTFALETSTETVHCVLARTFQSAILLLIHIPPEFRPDGAITKLVWSPTDARAPSNIADIYANRRDLVVGDNADLLKHSYANTFRPETGDWDVDLVSLVDRLDYTLQKSTFVTAIGHMGTLALSQRLGSARGGEYSCASPLFDSFTLILACKLNILQRQGKYIEDNARLAVAEIHEILIGLQDKQLSIVRQLLARMPQTEDALRKLQSYVQHLGRLKGEHMELLEDSRGVIAGLRTDLDHMEVLTGAKEVAAAAKLRKKYEHAVKTQRSIQDAIMDIGKQESEIVLRTDHYLFENIELLNRVERHFGELMAFAKSLD